MSWPHPPDYNEAIQNPNFCFNDPELQRGQPAVNALGLPWPRSGNHADVYKLECPGGQTWAVKCFTREVHDLRRRYQAISDHLRQTTLPAMVEFQYQDEGIRVHGQWYPIVKMRWVDGLALNELLREHADKPQVLERLAQLWLRLAQEMRNAQIAHGDLQHGNVLLIPGATAGTLKLRLVDYDGLVVPALAQVPSGEVGHPNYQHPQRLRDGTYDPEVDRFAHLVIYTAIRAVAVGGRPLWERHDNGENFLFREQDFQTPAQSRLFHELNELSDSEVRSLAGHLLLASIGPIGQVPLLDEVIVNGTVRPLEGEQQTEVARRLSGDSAGKAVAPEPTAGPTTIRLDRAGTATLVLGARKRTWRGPFAPPRGRFAFGDSLYRRGRRTAKRFTGWSLTAVLTLCAGLGVATFAMMVGIIFWIGTLVFAPTREAAAEAGDRGQASHTQSQKPAHPIAPLVPPRPAVPSPGTARLSSLPDVILRPGTIKTIRVQVQRAGRPGRFELAEPEDLPEGVTARILRVLDHDGDALQLELRAEAQASEGTTRIELRATLAGQTIQGATFNLTVQAPQPPRPVRPADLVLKPGQVQVVRIEVRREDHEGPIHIELYLPDWVTAKRATIPAGQIATPVELQVAENAPSGLWMVEVWAVVGGEKVGKATFWLRIAPSVTVREPELPTEKVRFTTVDGVHLVGNWYPSNGGGESACVLLLHQPGSEHTRTDWERLARVLQKNGHAVLAFDFRGHGDSTALEPVFWKFPANSRLHVSDPFETKLPESIHWKKIPPAYYPLLVNDIAAACSFLDQKNDQRQCNSSKLFLIGAEEGAVLGAMWLFTEWHRFQLTSPEPLLLSQAPEGRHYAGAIWVSISSRLGGRAYRVADWLKVAGSDRRVPMGFLHGGDDQVSGPFAQQCLREMKLSRFIRSGLTAEKIIPNTAATGHTLLEKIAADAFLETYVANVLQTEPRPRWSRRMSSVRSFYWQFPHTTGLPIPAKLKGETLLRPVPLERVP